VSYYPSVHFRGQQALPNYERVYRCDVCMTDQVQLGPGRDRKTCTRKKCQAAKKKLRKRLVFILRDL
jgi:hypothetical protein